MPANRFEMKGYVYAGPQPGFIMPEDTYDHYVMIAMEVGSFDYEVGEERGSAAFGDIVFCPPGTPFKRRAHGEVVFHIIHFTLNPEGSEPDERVPVGKVSISDTTRLSSTYSYMRNFQDRPGFNAPIPKVSHHLVSDLLFLCEMERQLALRSKKTIDPLMQQAAGYIHRHMFGEINMRSIASMLGIKQPQLTRRFQEAYGVGPVEYVTGLRLEEAKRLLMNSDDTLESIAERCGYESGSYFSRVFRAKVGLNPSVFRHNYRM